MSEVFLQVRPSFPSHEKTLRQVYQLKLCIWLENTGINPFRNLDLNDWTMIIISLIFQIKNNYFYSILFVILSVLQYHSFSWRAHSRVVQGMNFVKRYWICVRDMRGLDPGLDCNFLSEVFTQYFTGSPLTCLNEFPTQTIGPWGMDREAILITKLK